MQAHAIQHEVLPVHLVASKARLRPVEGDLIPFETPGYYDEVSQTWRDPDGQCRTVYAKRKPSTFCNGICGTPIGWVIASDQDEVSDD